MTSVKIAGDKKTAEEKPARKKTSAKPVLSPVSYTGKYY
jgi:hypothetical protein